MQARDSLAIASSSRPGKAMLAGALTALAIAAGTIGVAFIPLSNELAHAAAIVVATFASEDLTCIAAGLAIHEGRIAPVTATGACFVGIFVGDLGLWLMGRVIGRSVLSWPSVQRRIHGESSQRVAEWLNNHAAAAILSARFLPSARLPIYLAAGAMGQCFVVFAKWTFVATAFWAPLVVLSVAVLGRVIVDPIRMTLGLTWIALPIAAAVLFVIWRVVAKLTDRDQRLQWLARVARIWRWEFWPTWLFYAPFVPYLLYLSVRYRGPLVWTAANPGIPSGGVVGESKADILGQLPAISVLPYELIAAGPSDVRIAAAAHAIRQHAWQFPLILKPDAGQRGAGLKLARGWNDINAYVNEHPDPFLMQVYHAGPCEAGVFYYRIPGEARGHVFSITDKQFPEIVGDGQSTVAQLVWNHPRYRMQAGKFLARHAGEVDNVLPAGERMRLAVAGNHSQGTMFCDGAQLLTPELERAIDDVARRFAGFYIGRFDMRYSSVAQFMAGRELAIVELNGATSESTNVYDPTWSLWRAYRTLCRQWAITYRIGFLNQQRGVRPTAIRELLQMLFTFYHTRQVNPLAD